MKSKLFFVVALITVLFISTPAPCQDEQITLSTYYPAPYGEYDELCAEKLLVDTPAAAELQDMARGDCHITNSLIVGAGETGFSYDEIGGSLIDGTVLIKGDVGIGTTGPSQRLDIRDAAADGDRIYMRVGSDSTGAYPNRVVNVGYMFPPGDDNGAISAYDYTNNIYKEMRVAGSEVSFWTAPSAPGAQKRMTVDVNGNVGIGTSTFGQYEKVHIAGPGPVAVNIEGTTDGALRLVGTTPPATLWEVASRSDGRFGILQSGVGDRFVINTSGNVGIGTTSPDAKLEVSSTTSGFLPPKMTTAQMNAISSPAAGLMIYNNETNSWMGYNGTSWIPIGGGVQFGVWNDITNDGVADTISRDTTYQAQTSGIVSAYVRSDSLMCGYTHENRSTVESYSASALRTLEHGTENNWGNYGGITFPVKKGDYWRVRRVYTGGEGTCVIHWLPILD